MAKRRRDFTTMTLVSLAIVVWAAAAYFAFSRSKSKPTPEPPPTTAGVGSADTPAGPSAASSPEPAVASSSAEAAGGGSAPLASSSTSAAAAGSATGAPPEGSATAPADVTACVQAVFPVGSFNWRKPNFDFVCEMANPLKGGTEVRSQLVLGGGQNVTDAMRMWAGLGWYEMAAYSVLRAHCCSNPPELQWSFRLVCTVDESLAKLEAAVAKKDVEAVNAAAEAYLKDARCLSQFGQGRNFGQAAPPGAGQAGFKKILAGVGIEPVP